MKWKQLKLYVMSFCLSFLVCVSLILSPMSYIGSYASTTSGSEEGNVFELTEDYVRDNFTRLCRYVVRWNAVISDSIIGTWQDFTTWLDNNNHGDIWEQNPHSPIRVQNGVENVEVPQEVLNVINQYVIYQIQQNPLTYSQCYIRSYSSVNVDWFPTYQLYATWKQWAKQQDGYILTTRSISGGNVNGLFARVIPKTNDINFVGTTNYGGFSNVRLYIGWSTSNSPWTLANGTSLVKINNNGNIDTNVSNGDIASTVGNTTNIYDGTTSRMTIWTNLEKDELVYVFNTLSALKHYQSGQPQAYYLTSEGLGTNMSNWEVGSGTINTGTLSSANSSYNQVINNITNGLSANDVLKIVDYVVTHTDGNGSSDDEEEEDDNPITKLIKDIVGGIGGFLTGLIEGIADALLGEVNSETGLREGGLLSTLKNIFTSLLETLTGGVIFDFLSAFMSWLPEDIINVLTALFGVAVTFAVIKCVRNAL